MNVSGASSSRGELPPPPVKRRRLRREGELPVQVEMDTSKVEKTEPVFQDSSPKGFSRYMRLSKTPFGEGTYGTVFLAVDQLDPQRRRVAIKKIKMKNDSEGISRTALREIKMQREFEHENVSRLCDVFAHRATLYLVFDFYETDLEQVIRARTVLVLSPADIKSYMFMLLKGVAELHRRWILHRDLKPGNLFVSDEGVLKIGDFGLARYFGDDDRRLTDVVCTRWYRAPELFFGCQQYTTSEWSSQRLLVDTDLGVDMWSVGMIFAELMLRLPFFSGDSDIEQLSKIFSVLGTPSEENWKGVTELPSYVGFAESQPIPLSRIFTAASDDALDLLQEMVRFDPVERITAAAALQHRYFSTLPLPTDPSRLKLPKANKRLEIDVRGAESRRMIKASPSGRPLLDDSSDQKSMDEGDSAIPEDEGDSAIPEDEDVVL